MARATSSADYDALIVGARCAGAATALLLAKAGLKVLVLDRASQGSDTLSTSFLMRGAVHQLHRWGLLEELAALGTPKVRRTLFHYEGDTLEVAIRQKAGVDALYAPRRTVLDPLLSRAAQAAGAEVHFGTQVEELLRNTDGRVCGARVAFERGHSTRIRARHVIGADGVHSSVARWVEAETYRQGEHMGPCVYGYFSGLDVDAYHWYYGQKLAAGVAPTNGNATTVFTSTTSARFPEFWGDRQQGFMRILSTLAPDLAARVADAKRLGSLRAFPGILGFVRMPYGPGWALVGDAGFFRDPITAHGITDALRDAELLARALLEDSDAALARYHAQRDAAGLRLFEATERVAAFDWDRAGIEASNRAAGEGMQDSMNAILALDTPRTGSSETRTAISLTQRV